MTLPKEEISPTSWWAVPTDPDGNSIGLFDGEMQRSRATRAGRVAQECQTGGMRILVLNGPNLGRLGTREPDVYGTATLADIAPLVASVGTADAPIEPDVRQTDDEAELVGWIHEAVDAATPVILNPAAFTHYSYALRDACAQLQGVAPLVEVHISNPHAREAFRRTSVVSAVATGVIAGFGLDGYRLAAAAIAAR